MNIKDIPFIIPNFNQLTYLKNLISQVHWYYPDNWIYILDNGSSYKPLLEYYEYIQGNEALNASVSDFSGNDFIKNLNQFLEDNANEFPYYIITDPDLQIHPATPPNFLEIFKAAIDSYGFHHAGFGLITDDIPSWNPKAGWIQGDEKALLQNPVTIEHEGKSYQGFKAPIDTCFAMYKRSNGGWKAPMSGEDWGNSLRLFWAHHLPWYLHKDFLNPEMQNYFATCKRFEPGQVSSGKNNYRPE